MLDVNRERVTNTTTTEANIQHLKPHTEYEYRVIAYNRFGASRQEARITVTTDQEGRAGNIIQIITLDEVNKQKQQPKDSTPEEVWSSGLVLESGP